MRYRRKTETVEAHVWRSITDKTPGVLYGTRAGRPRPYVKTVDGPVDLLEGTPVYVWPSKVNGCHIVMAEDKFLSIYEVE